MVANRRSFSRQIDYNRHHAARQKLTHLMGPSGLKNAPETLFVSRTVARRRAVLAVSVGVLFLTGLLFVIC